MKSNSKILGFSVAMLTLVACQNITGDPYITPCVKASKITAKMFQNKYDKGDKAFATGLCTCRSRGLQSLLSVEEYDGLIRATKAGKTKKFRVIEQKYLTDLISANPNRGTAYGTFRHVCEKYAVEMRNSVYKKKELPELPY